MRERELISAAQNVSEEIVYDGGLSRNPDRVIRKSRQ